MSKLEYDNVFASIAELSLARQLKRLYNALYRACTLSHSYRLAVKDLHLPRDMEAMIEVREEATLEEMMSQYEAQLLHQFYAEYPSTRKLAQRLGLSHTAVANKLRQYGLTKNGNSKDE